MFDDGQHGDGAAGDHIFGCQVTLSGTAFVYYIYAENSNAVSFSPSPGRGRTFAIMLSKALLKRTSIQVLSLIT